MPKIDPKFAFWFGVWTNVLPLIASLGVDHAPTYVAQYASDVQWFAKTFAKINGVVLTAFAALSSNQAGPFVSAPLPSVTGPVVKVLLAAFAVSFLLAGAPSAHAQDIFHPKAQRQAAAPATVDPLQKLMDDIAAKKVEFVANVVAAIQEADDAATLTNRPWRSLELPRPYRARC